MQNKLVSYKTALWLSLGISLLMNMVFILTFFMGRDGSMPAEGSRNFRFGGSINTTLVHALMNFVMAYLLYMINFKMFRLSLRRNVWGKWWIIIPVTLVSTIVLSYLITWFYMYTMWGGQGPVIMKFMRGSMMRDLMIAVIVVLSSQLIFISSKQQQTALENKTLMAENLSTRYAALKSQVDPHFLFNSLNTLNSLIKVDADKAQEYVQQLSYVFRYTLQSRQTIPLREELHYTQAYCHLMQIRYGDALEIVQQVDSRYDEYSIIPLSLQTLVENAIKHNVVSNKQPLRITIATRDNDTVAVTNPIQPKKEPESGAGIGLSNLTERYRLMWHKEISVIRNDRVFEVVIPLHREDRIIS